MGPLSQTSLTILVFFFLFFGFISFLFYLLCFSHVFFCFLILSQTHLNIFVFLFSLFFCLFFPCAFCFLYVPFICGICLDSPEPWARGERRATQRQVQRDSQLAAGRCASFRLPSAPPTAYTFIAPAPAILSCPDKLKATCTVRLIRQKKPQANTPNERNNTNNKQP